MTEPDKLLIATADDMRHISQMEIKRVLRNHHILELIKEKGKVTAYSLSKIMEFDYSTIQKVLKDLEYCGLVISENIVTSENRLNKLYFVPKGDENVKL